MGETKRRDDDSSPSRLLCLKQHITLLLPYLVILALGLIFFKPWFADGKVFLAADTLFEYYPWKSFAPQGFHSHNPLIDDPVKLSYAEGYNRQLKGNGLTLWNPYVLAGMPSISSPSLGGSRWYPPKYLLHRELPTHVAFTYLLLMHLLLMGCTMLFYLRCIGAGIRGALFGAIAYMFNGCAMVWLSFETVLPYSAFLPLLMFSMERFLRKDRLVYALGGGLIVGILFLLGHTHYSLLVGVIMVFYYFFLLIRVSSCGEFLKDALAVTGCFAVMAVTGLLIGAVELLPMYEIIENSSRVSRTLGFDGLFETLGRVPFRFLATLIFPAYFGTPPMGFNHIPRLPGQEYMNYNELCLYLGLPTLLGLLAAVVDPKKPHTRFFLLLTVFVGGMMAGTVLFWPFFKFFPGLDRLNPTRLVFLFTTVATISAGLGFDRVQTWSSRRKAVFMGLSSLWIGGVLLLACLSDAEWLIKWFNRELFDLPGVDPPSLVTLLSELRSFTSPVIFWQVHIAVGSLVLFTAILYLRNRIASLTTYGLILGLLAYDLISFAWGYNTVVDPQFLYPPTPSIDWLQKQPGPFRVLQDVSGNLSVNTLVPFGIEELGGYTPVYSSRINKLMSFIHFGDKALNGRNFDRWVKFRNPVSPWYDLLNVRYILTAPGKTITPSSYRLVWHGDLDIYENPNAFPRAFVVHHAVVRRGLDAIIEYMASGQFDPAREVILEEDPPADSAPISESPSPSTAAIENRTPDRVTVAAHMTANGWLVLSDAYFPGWKVFVDEKEAPLLPADCALRAVALREGEHRVVFQYEPASVWWGKSLTIAGFLGVSVFGGGVWLCGKRRALPEFREKGSMD